MPSFLSILKAVAKGVGIVAGILPQVQAIAQPYAPQRVNTFLERIVGAVARAEQAANVLSQLGASVGGQGKLAIAEAFAGDALDVAEMISGKEIGDNDKYKRGIDSIAQGKKLILSGIADVLDSVKH